MENTTSTTTDQVAKYKAKIQKKDIIKVQRKFNFINLTAVIAHAKSAPMEKTKVSTRFRSTRTKEMNWTEPTITDTSIIETEFGSIKRYLNECHPDINTLIHKNQISSVKAECGQLVVVTQNKLRIVITTIAKYERKVVITDKRRNVLFNQNTTVRIIKEDPSRLAAQH